MPANRDDELDVHVKVNPKTAHDTHAVIDSLCRACGDLALGGIPVSINVDPPADKETSD